MKKILIPILTLLLSFTIASSNAQAPRTAQTNQAAPARSTQAKTTENKAPAKEHKEEAKMKKDGTPDMRYKENKNGAKPAETKHLKKDGTPDKRFSENKK